MIKVTYATLGAIPSAGERRFETADEFYTWVRNTAHVHPIVITGVREAVTGVTPRVAPGFKGKSPNKFISEGMYYVLNWLSTVRAEARVWGIAYRSFPALQSAVDRGWIEVLPVLKDGDHADERPIRLTEAGLAALADARKKWGNRT